jgi:hypothetical protein
MSFLDRLRNWFSGPPHIKPGDDEGRADLIEEYGTVDEADTYLKQTELRSHNTLIPGVAAEESTELAEEDVEVEEEAPRDPSP